MNKDGKAIAAVFWHPLRSRLSAFKVVSGIVVAFVLSFTLYFFSCALMEAFRLMSVTPEYDIWVPSAKERSFYQLFFAFVSVILAQSFCLAYWFDRPRQVFERGHFSAVQMVNGQRNLNWYFLSWFAKVVFCWFIVFSFPGGFYAFSLYPGFKCFFILIIIVLFLHPWVTMRQAFKRKTLRWMALSALLVTVLALGMSRINLIDYESLENVFLSRNVPHTYGLELPATDAVEKMEHTTLFHNVYLVQSKDEAEPKRLIIVDGKTVDLQEFSEVMEEWRSCHSEVDYPLLSCRLIVDKSLKMKDVDEVRQALADMRFYRIQFAVVPKHPELDIRYYTYLSFPMRMPVRFVDTSYYRQALEDVREVPNRISVSQIGADAYSINGVSVCGEDCKPMLKRLIQRDLDYVVCFKVDDEMRFGDYMVIVTSTKEALNELMEEYACGKYSKPLDRLNDDENMEIRHRFLFRLFEEKFVSLQLK